MIPHRKNSGFTVVELVVTMVISTIAFLLIYPTFQELNQSIQVDYEADNAESRLWKNYQKLYPYFLSDSCIVLEINSFKFYSHEDTSNLRYENDRIILSTGDTLKGIVEFEVKESQHSTRANISLSTRDGATVRSLQWPTPIKVITNKNNELIWD